MTDSNTYAFALHGGAGVTPGRDYSAAEVHMRELALACERDLQAGAAALDIVTRAVEEMETSGLYVAGRGSAPNDAGYVELDASIMDGAKRQGGSIAAARDVMLPIRAARAVMEKSEHVMLTARGAERFCRHHGLEFVAEPDSYYRLPAGVVEEDLATANRAHGTVGAVALDHQGRLAAATSTGGIFGKSAGRLGDTPIIGAGTRADENVAVSCTELGEAFIPAGGAQDAASRVRYGSQPLDEAVEGLIADVGARDGDGGVIAVDREGRVSMHWNSPGMKRARGSSRVAVQTGVR
ncbi:isoaspartyl peptidase/L-asparaginase [Maricaulis sp.]|uniref:isoaspartyl peptidase/L-asparaginase family protein n=1 Tax=Maricaulis sp. TaxID=1486257 RepID=UPI001AFE10F2|nr:isoaspartyl peptidase/L-asparaginase [Maricaulis sp.]MBO6797779.1 isoaspartyl peptidase/L-asparaginase [Maricaulis sp.]